MRFLIRVSPNHTHLKFSEEKGHGLLMGLFIMLLIILCSYKKHSMFRNFSMNKIFCIILWNAKRSFGCMSIHCGHRLQITDCFWLSLFSSHKKSLRFSCWVSGSQDHNKSKHREMCSLVSDLLLWLFKISLSFKFVMKSNRF